MGASVSKKRCEERCSSCSRHGYSQECFDYVSNYLFPPGSYLNGISAAHAHSCSTSSEPNHLTPNAQPLLPSAPVLLLDAYDVDEEAKQIDMAIRASLDVPNSPRTSSSLSMNSRYACDVDEEEWQINMAIRASLKAPSFPRTSSTPSMNPSYCPEWSSSRFNNGSSSTSSHSQNPTPSAPQIPNQLRRELVECGICFEVSEPAICDPCGHVCCYECLLQIQGSTNSNRCPRCRVVITKVMRIYI